MKKSKKEIARNHIMFHLAGLKDYNENYSDQRYLIQMKEDILKGAYQLAHDLDLMTFEEYWALRKKYGV